MEEETQVNPALEENEEETTDEEVLEEQQEEVDWKSEAEKAKELAENYKRRAEKAEKKAKSTVTNEQQKSLTGTDIIFIAKNDIHDDDVSDIIKWSKNEGVSVKEAYTMYKPILDRRAEERTTAAVTHTTASARTANKTSGTDILRKAERNEAIDEKDIAKLAEARYKAGRR